MASDSDLVRPGAGEAGVSTVVFAGLALLRLRRRWSLALAMLLGIAIAVALATSVTLVQSTSAELGLQRAIAGRDSLVEVTQADTDSAASFDEFAATTRHKVGSVRLLTPSAVYLASSNLVPVTVDGRPLHYDPSGTLPDLRFYPDLGPRIQMTSGQVPAGRASGGLWQVLISTGTAKQFGLAPGEVLCLSDFSGAQVCVEVAAVFRAKEPGSGWWGHDGVPGVSLVLADEAGYFALIGQTSNARSFAHASFTPDPAAFRTYRVESILDSINRLRGFFTILQSSGTVSTGLDTDLAAYYQRFEGAQFALELVLAETLLIALLYLGFVSRHVLDQQAQALAVWRSRGWRRRSIFTLLVFEFAIVAAAAIPVGLALGVVGAAASLHVVYGSAQLQAGLADLPALWEPAVAAAGLGLAVLGWRAAQASRRSLTGARGLASRPAVRPWWQWRFLDLGLALLGLGMLLYAPAFAHAGSGGSFDPTGLALAGLGLVLLALAALRLLPPAARLLGLLGQRLALALAAWQLSRRPLQHSLLALLLVVTLALGVFASSYRATEQRNTADRAAYLAGADVRAHFTSDRPFPPARQLASQAAQEVKGIEMVSYVYRGSGQPRQAPVSPAVLGVDPNSLSRVAWSRPGLNPLPLGRLLQRLMPGPGVDALPLPGRPASLGVWVWSPGLTGEVAAEVEDAAGRTSDVALGSLDYTGWRYLEAPMPAEQGGVRYPLFVHQLAIQQPVPRPSGSRSPPRGTIAVADLGVTAPDASRPQVVEPFSPATAAHWFATDSTTGLNPGPLALSTSLEHGGHPVVLLTPDTSAGDMVLRRVPAPTPLPTLAPQRTLDSLGVGVGDVFPLTVDSVPVPVQVVGTVGWFPTMYPVENKEGQNPDFLLLDGGPFLDDLAFGKAPHAWPNELWIQTTGHDDAALVKLLQGGPAVDQVWSRRALQGAARADPLGLELGANLVVGFAAALVLAVVAFGLHFLVAARGRSSEYAILDANGLEPATVQRSLLAEQGVLLAFSLLAGTALGGAVAVMMLPSLGFDPSLQGTVPPTVVTFDPALTGGALAAVLLLALLAGQLANRAGRRFELMAELRMLS